MTTISVPISHGELIDKLTILEIKCARMTDPTQRAHVEHERALLDAVLRAGVPADDRLPALRKELSRINAALWDIEDEIRACEARRDFSERFIALARSVYRTNDHRAAIKKQINLMLGSELVEEKSYVDPDTGEQRRADPD